MVLMPPRLDYWRIARSRALLEKLTVAHLELESSVVTIMTFNTQDGHFTGLATDGRITFRCILRKQGEEVSLVGHNGGLL
jgi:hypothetical protein